MFARTARLMLRPGWPEDAPALALALGHAAVATRLAHVPWPYALGDAQWFLQQPWGPERANFLVFDDPAGAPQLVGGIELALGDDDAAELGYWLTPTAWGRGYASEAGAAVLAIARQTLRLRRLYATPFVDNRASMRVLEKLGFRTVGQPRPLFNLARGRDESSVRYELDLATVPAGDPELRLAA